MVLGEVAEAEGVADSCRDNRRIESEFSICANRDGNIFCESERESKSEESKRGAEMHGEVLSNDYTVQDSR